MYCYAFVNLEDWLTGFIVTFYCVPYGEFNSAHRVNEVRGMCLVPQAMSGLIVLCDT